MVSTRGVKLSLPPSVVRKTAASKTAMANSCSASLRNSSGASIPSNVIEGTRKSSRERNAPGRFRQSPEKPTIEKPAKKPDKSVMAGSKVKAADTTKNKAKTDKRTNNKGKSALLRDSKMVAESNGKGAVTTKTNNKRKTDNLSSNKTIKEDQPKVKRIRIIVKKPSIENTSEPAVTKSSTETNEEGKEISVKIRLDSKIMPDSCKATLHFPLLSCRTVEQVEREAKLAARAAKNNNANTLKAGHKSTKIKQEKNVAVKATSKDAKMKAVSKKENFVVEPLVKKEHATSIKETGGYSNDMNNCKPTAAAARLKQIKVEQEAAADDDMEEVKEAAADDDMEEVKEAAADDDMEEVKEDAVTDNDLEEVKWSVDLNMKLITGISGRSNAKESSSEINNNGANAVKGKQEAVGVGESEVDGESDKKDATISPVKSCTQTDRQQTLQNNPDSNATSTTTSPNLPKSKRNRCKSPSCNRYRQSHTGGYCLTHKHCALHPTQQVQFSTSSPSEAKELLKAAAAQRDAMREEAAKNVEAPKRNQCRFEGCGRYRQSHTGGYCLRHKEFGLGGGDGGAGHGATAVNVSNVTAEGATANDVTPVSGPLANGGVLVGAATTTTLAANGAKKQKKKKKNVDLDMPPLPDVENADIAMGKVNEELPNLQNVDMDLGASLLSAASFDSCDVHGIDSLLRIGDSHSDDGVLNGPASAGVTALNGDPIASNVFDVVHDSLNADGILLNGDSGVSHTALLNADSAVLVDGDVAQTVSSVIEENSHTIAPLVSLSAPTDGPISQENLSMNAPSLQPGNETDSSNPLLNVDASIAAPIISQAEGIQNETVETDVHIQTKYNDCQSLARATMDRGVYNRICQRLGMKNDRDNQGQRKDPPEQLLKDLPTPPSAIDDDAKPPPPAKTTNPPEDNSVKPTAAAALNPPQANPVAPHMPPTKQNLSSTTKAAITLPPGIALEPRSKSKANKGRAVCQVVGCEKLDQSNSNGLCRAHYNLIYVESFRQRDNSDEPWTCPCGEKVTGKNKKRCGSCFRWKGGVREPYHPGNKAKTVKKSRTNASGEYWTCQCGNEVEERKQRCGICHHWRGGKRLGGWKLGEKPQATNYYACDDGIDRSTDWECCGEVILAKKTRCGKCKGWRGGKRRIRWTYAATSSAAGGDGERDTGEDEGADVNHAIDWTCTKCSNVNKADKEQCGGCSASRPPRKRARSSAPLMAQSQDTTGNGTVEASGEHWMCKSCSYDNFATDIKCLMCQIPRPNWKKSSKSSSSSNNDFGTKGGTLDGVLLTDTLVAANKATAESRKNLGSTRAEATASSSQVVNTDVATEAISNAAYLNEDTGQVSSSILSTENVVGKLDLFHNPLLDPFNSTSGNGEHLHENTDLRNHSPLMLGLATNPSYSDDNAIGGRDFLDGHSGFEHLHSSVLDVTSASDFHVGSAFDDCIAGCETSGNNKESKITENIVQV